MINPLFLRLFHSNSPVTSLNNEQRKALTIFREKIKQGTYSFEYVPCLCGRQDGKLIAQRDRYALPVNTCLCKTCGVMWTNPRMTESTLLKFYEDDYRPIYVGQAQAPENFFTSQVQYGKYIYDFVIPYFQSKSNAKPTIFDIGCGAGGVLIPFAENGWSVYGCDMGDQYLQRGRAAGLILEQGDLS